MRMKTPDEIKKGLECCVTQYNCHIGDEQCCYHGGGECHYFVMCDALSYIQQLEARLVDANKTSDELKAKLAEYEKPLVPMTLEEAFAVSRDEAKKLVEALREDAEWAHANEWETPITLGDHLVEAADLIKHLSSVAERSSAKAALCEKVMEDYDKMRRERDAAVDDIELGVCCETCKHDDGVFCVECARVASRGNWEWRGVHENA